MRVITVDHKRYKVLEDLGFQFGSCRWAKIVETELGPKMAVRGCLKGSEWMWVEHD